MLSKCLNSRCSATFQYLGRGRLFRIDFADVGRKCAHSGKQLVASIRSKACPIEHFWLCENCATTMTVALSDGGEVRLVPYEVAARKPAATASPQSQPACKATAS
jgi:hypothetical protein